MPSSRVEFQQTTVEVLRAIEQIFGADERQAEEFFYVASQDNQDISYVSSGYPKVWGIIPDALRKNPMEWMKRIHPDDLHRVSAAFDARARAGSMDVEYRIVRLDQQVRVIQDRSYLLPGGVDGRPFVVGRCRDVTGIRATESTVLEQQQEIDERTVMLREIAECVDDVFWVFDTQEKRLLYVGPAYENLWGRSRQELLANPSAWYEAVHPDDRGRLENLFAVPPAENARQRTYRIINAGGDIHTVREHVFGISGFSKSGAHSRRLAGVVTDITKDLQAEDNRLQLVLEHAGRQNAEDQVRARDDVLAVVSHDLRNPLFAIATLAHRLGKPMDEEKRAACVAAVHRSVERMNHLIEDLLDVSRIEANQFHIKRETVDLPAMLADIGDSFADWPGRDQVLLTVDVDVDPAIHMIEGDSFRLQQVLSNLITNAFKFTPAGGSIQVQVARRSADVLVAVRDTGMGISPEDQTHLFDRFWQADRRDRRGAGLGLAIAKGIVEAHGGRIWIESALHRGTSCLFTLPLPEART